MFYIILTGSIRRAQSFTEFSGQKTYFFITFFRQKNKRTYSALSFCSFDKKTCHVARLNKPWFAAIPLKEIKKTPWNTVPSVVNYVLLSQIQRDIQYEQPYFSAIRARGRPGDNPLPLQQDWQVLPERSQKTAAPMSAPTRRQIKYLYWRRIYTTCSSQYLDIY